MLAVLRFREDPWRSGFWLRQCGVRSRKPAENALDALQKTSGPGGLDVEPAQGGKKAKLKMLLG